MNAHKKLLSLAKLGLLTCAISVHAPATGPCKFTAPACWSLAHTKWDGECVDGVAHGLGVLKELALQLEAE